ncbi:hypothetical protein TcarDRAFT_1608 [Thermosinus carboxydivorans Nor1]|uniref:Stage III sporulation protein AG n=1 Tax=Thermosinus carboxydivorans Nor1 TaxID=401526 RepID=A1HQ72_9FIRM|nr:hypothetical protein [Thermosinus carboxydivorans]EAX47919.1 hypothetical protein TcarDRAFT_1608 [Thermosinus carboxydivorans Nor1]
MNGFISTAKKMFSFNIAGEGGSRLRLIFIGLCGVLLIIAGGMLETPGAKLKVESVPQPAKALVVSRSYEEALEAKMANLLSQVKGAGAVSVSITLENGGVQEHAKNIVKETKVIQEKDTAGGTRVTTETRENEQILLSKEGGADRPVMVRETKPVIKGVLVIADGAYDSSVKANLTKAVEAGLGVPAYKITVLPQRK